MPRSSFNVSAPSSATDLPVKVRVARRAAAEISQIGRYIAQFDGAASQRLLRRIDHTITVTIATHPMIGVSREDVSPGLRVFVVGNYLICYRVTATAIRVTRVFHGAQDILRQFR